VEIRTAPLLFWINNSILKIKDCNNSLDF
jgi:hypothetical protein